MESVFIICVVSCVILRYVKVRAMHNKLNVSSENTGLISHYDAVISISDKAIKLIKILCVIFICLFVFQFGQMLILGKSIIDSMSHVEQVLIEMSGK